jgi:resuscitation-promoting factor RpfB
MLLRTWILVAALALAYVSSSGKVLRFAQTKPGHVSITSNSDSVGSNSDCDPNYAGGCVPIASDVDCAGGNGNGPAYVHGTVQVVGKDIYGLDADHDGLGCEPYKR